MSCPPPFRHGLVVGKFYPPHMGHIYLIRSAAEASIQLTVAVLASSVESIPMEERIEWLKACFDDMRHVCIVGELDDVPVDYDDPGIWDAHVDIMREAIEQAGIMRGVRDVPVDAVFSSETYGEELARRFNAVNVCLDHSRHLYPVSGTAVRQDVCGHWHMLPRAVRAGLVQRVVLVGAESSGTTTLSLDLARALRERGGVWSRTEWVAEYGREYSANALAILRARSPGSQASDIKWQEHDFVRIAQEQIRREQEAAETSSPVLVCDTDVLATGVWHERYCGTRSPTVEDLARQAPPRALYILTDCHGVAFENDGLRDGEHVRHWMQERFVAVLADQQVPWIVISGSYAERLKIALCAIDALLTRAWRFSDPLEQRNIQ